MIALISTTLIGFVSWFSPQYTRQQALSLCDKEIPKHNGLFPSARFFCYDHRFPCSYKHSVELVAVWKEGDVVMGDGHRSVPKKWEYKESVKTKCF